MKMLIPPGWDEASPENAGLCLKFAKKTGTAAESGLPYRLFTPVRMRGKKVPLVVFLHGADAAGDDNELQLSMHDIGTVLVRDDMQKDHPCYVLAPQYGEMQHWSMKDIKEGLWNLITDTAGAYSDIDTNRIYVYGYSAGGVGTIRLIKENPGFFAAAVAICGATSPWGIDKLLKTPLWMTHARDDSIVKAVYRKDKDAVPGNLGSHDIYDWYLKRRKEKKGRVCEMKYTEYPEGFMDEKYGVNPHCSWVVLSDPANTEVWEWMFSHSLEAR